MVVNTNSNQIYPSDQKGMWKMNINVVMKGPAYIGSKSDLKIDLNCNLDSVDFLNVNLNLKEGVYKPYRKPNNEILYVSKKSNHPPTVVKNIPKSIGTMLSTLSSNKEICVKASGDYMEALLKSGYDQKI